jgi:tetratricopeptide (TPR) repeat protein
VANSYALQEQWEQAMTLYEELLTLGSLPAQLAVETKLELAFCYEHQELFDDALKLYQELEEIDSTQVIIDTASVARKIERVQEALKDSKKGPAKVQWQRKKK